jgi:hypothetical protein
MTTPNHTAKVNKPGIGKGTYGVLSQELVSKQV